MKTKSSISKLTQKNVELIAKMEAASEKGRTFGERVADGFAMAIGSWTFIIAQSVLLALWMVLNLVAWIHHWDPYPFILLNLALSFQAAFAAPVLMMSQNRQSRLIERRNHLDLQINLLAEQENTETIRLLRRLCEKSGISLSADPNTECLAENTNPDALIHQIEQTTRRKKTAV